MYEILHSAVSEQYLGERSKSESVESKRDLPPEQENTQITTSSLHQRMEDIFRNVRSTFRRVFGCYGCKGGPRVHAGFWEAYSAIRIELYRAIAKALVDITSDLDIKPKKFRLYFTGHSLGGALATLACLDISMNLQYIIRTYTNIFKTIRRRVDFQLDIPDIELYTYGSPRVGNLDFKDLFESHVENSFRIEVNGDMICRMPMLAGYRHAAVVPVLLCDGAAPCNIAYRVEEHSDWWNTSVKGHSWIGTQCTTLIVQPTYAQYLLSRMQTGAPKYHGLVAYRNYLESLLTIEEKEVYHQKTV